MPSTSKKQHNFMAAVANSPAFAKKVGVPQSVGKDFNQADKGRKFSKGGDMKKMKFDDDREPGSSGGSKGDRVGAPGGDDMVGAYKRGGMAHEDVKMDKKMMQKAVNKHEGRLHKGQPMTKFSKGGVTRADGCVTKGHTKGTMVKMAGGGYSC
jgi:hypothetical protein